MFKIYKKFITEDECVELSNWIFDNIDLFKVAGHPGTVRKTTRFNTNVKYPDVAYSVQKRMDDEICKEFSTSLIARVPDFVDGMYASCGYNGDACETHCDPVWIDNHVTYHFNLILSNHHGGKLIIEDRVIELEKNDAILYPVSKLKHSTTMLLGANIRLVWCFGYCVSE